jgi:hypothetical protein
MAPSARTVLPTDLVALVSYDGRVYSNEAMTRDRIGTNDAPHPLGTAIEQWFSFPTGRHTSISVQGSTLRGLVSARKRGSRLAWEIDCLIHAAKEENGVLLALLEQLTRASGKSGALRIFIRLPAASDTRHVVMRCGFAPYQNEVVYSRQLGDEHHAPAEGLRRRAKSDLYGIFRLYNAIVPHHVRTAEAMTFAEWTAAQESLGKTAQYVLERDGQVRGWLRVARDGDVARFDVLADHDEIDGLVESALARSAGCHNVHTVVAAHDAFVRERLESLGFVEGDEFTAMARRTVRFVKAARAVSVLAHTPG